MDDNTMEELKRRIFGEPEVVDLCEDLEAAKIRVGDKWTIRHRFLVEENYNPIHNNWYNTELQREKAKAERLRNEGEWWEYIQCHKKAFWPTVIEEIKNVVPNTIWNDVVRNGWCFSDNLWENNPIWRRIFLEKDRLESLVNQGELAVWASESDSLTVYRGCKRNHQDGMSWTVKMEVAKIFKYRAKVDGVIYKGKVKKAHVIAFFTPKEDEFEIVAFPENVTNKEIIE